MAKKKRKGAKPVRPETATPSGGGASSFGDAASPFGKASSPFGGASGKFGGVLPFAAVAALALAYVAAWGGAAAGTLDMRGVFNFDTVFPWFVFRDLFLSDAWPASGWRRNVSPFDFPETATMWALFSAGGLRLALALAPAVYAALSVVGWILVCDLLYGKSPTRRAVVVLLHIPAFLIIAWRGQDIFSPQLWINFRYGTWAVFPWLLWLLLRAVDAGDAKDNGKEKDAGKARLIRLALLAAGLAVMTESDPAVFPWFVAPALFSLLCLCALKKMRGAEFIRFAAACVVGVAGGFVLRTIPNFHPNRSEGEFLGFNAEKFLYALSNMAFEFSDIAARNIPETAAWTAFAGVALWRLSVALRSGSSGKKSGRSGGVVHSLFGVPDSRTHLLVAIFVPASAAACVAAVLATGNFHQNYWRDNLAPALRYLYPAIYLPLFVGWVLFPWNAPLFRKSGKALAAGVVVVAVALSAPRVVSFNVAAMDPFASPLQKCFAENARRLGWTGGIATSFFTLPFAANPESGAERMMPVGVLRRGSGESFLYLDWQTTNRHWFGDEFQFVVLNMFNGRVFGLPPRAADAGCPLEDSAECVPAGHGALFLDDAAARGAFGDPAEIVECAGVGFYHYDPPLKFALPEDPDFAQVGGRF